MLSKKLQLLAQIVGCVTIGLLAVYGLLMILSGNSPVWAAIGQAAPRLGTASSIPATFNYQGFLRDPDGSLTTGSYTITARIYDQGTEGSTLYTTIVPNVTVRDGLFNIVLGDDPSMSDEVFADVPRYIGISLNNDPELIPRQRLHAVPWALYATNAMTATTAMTAKTATTLVSDTVIIGGHLRLQNNATGTKMIGLRTSGDALDIDTTGGDLYINTDHNPPTTTRMIRLNGNVMWTGHLTSLTISFHEKESEHAGEQSKVMTLSANSVCFLNKVDLWDPYTHHNLCRIDDDGTNWVLKAYADTGTNSRTWCSARCLEW